MSNCKKMKRRGRNVELEEEEMVQTSEGAHHRRTFDSVKKKLNFDEDYAILPYEAGK